MIVKMWPRTGLYDRAVWAVATDLRWKDLRAAGCWLHGVRPSVRPSMSFDGCPFECSVALMSSDLTIIGRFPYARCWHVAFPHFPSGPCNPHPQECEGSPSHYFHQISFPTLKHLACPFFAAWEWKIVALNLGGSWNVKKPMIVSNSI